MPNPDFISEAKPGLFISYRRNESSYIVDRLRGELSRRCSSFQIFRDIDSIQPGQNFKQAIQQALHSCMVVLAVIGPDWAHATDAAGKRRLFESTDFVRAEISYALKNSLIVVPILTDRAIVPSRSDLPDDLWELSDLQALQLRSGDDFERDVNKLTFTLKQLTKQSSATSLKTLQPPPFGSLGW